jgi:hypothetical protein
MKTQTQTQVQTQSMGKIGEAGEIGKVGDSISEFGLRISERFSSTSKHFNI